MDFLGQRSIWQNTYYQNALQKVMLPLLLVTKGNNMLFAEGKQAS